jgi:hypothetical protein
MEIVLSRKRGKKKVMKRMNQTCESTLHMKMSQGNPLYKYYILIKMFQTIGPEILTCTSTKIYMWQINI